MHSLEYGKHYRKPSTSLRYKRSEVDVATKSFSRDLLQNSNLSSPRDNEEEKNASSLLKVQTDRAPLLFSIKANKKKGYGKILVVSQSHSDEMMSDLKQSTKDSAITHLYKHLFFGPQFDTEAFKKHLTMIHKGLIYCIKSLKSPSEKFIRSKQVSLCELGPSKDFFRIPFINFF